MAKSDFNHDQPKPAGFPGADPRDSGTPKTGFSEAPTTKQDRGGPGQMLPPNSNRIK